MTIIVAILIYIAYRFLHNYNIFMWIAIGVCLAALIFFGFILTPIFFKKSSYTISSDSLKKKSTMFFLTKQFMKTSSIQYISSIITPFSKITGLNFVIVNAWGGKMILNFLPRDEALELVSQLSYFAETNNSNDF